MDKEFVRTLLALDELKELGYKEVWLGRIPNPHWPGQTAGDFIIAAPKLETHGWPALWTVSEKTFGSMGCGNGLRNADQCQRTNVREMIPGHYNMTESGWERL